MKWRIDAITHHPDHHLEYFELMQSIQEIHTNKDFDDDEIASRIQELKYELAKVCITPSDALGRPALEKDITFDVEPLCKVNGLKKEIYSIKRCSSIEAYILSTKLRDVWKNNSLEYTAAVNITGLNLLRFTNEYNMKEVKRASDWLLFWSRKSFGFNMVY